MPLIAHASSDSYLTDVGTTITMRCDDGYLFQSGLPTHTITCLPTLAWDDEAHQLVCKGVYLVVPQDCDFLLIQYNMTGLQIYKNNIYILFGKQIFFTLVEH